MCMEALAHAQGRKRITSKGSKVRGRTCYWNTQNFCPSSCNQLFSSIVRYIALRYEA